jgi:hypothetical protein
MKRMIGWLAMAMLLVACGGSPDHGPPLGPFAAISKTEADPPFNIVPPSSKSPVPFTYTSSNPKVATIAGSLVTIQGPGESVITASQAADGQWGPTSASTTLTVSACVPPATKVNNQCVAPTTAATIFHSSTLAWMGVSHDDTWANARDFCRSTIEGQNGWRQPTSKELTDLQASGLLPNGSQGWTLGATWSSDAGAGAGSHKVVDLSSGGAAERGDTVKAYVSCVR